MVGLVAAVAVAVVDGVLPTIAYPPVVAVVVDGPVVVVVA
jgi:hypothetical protein